MLNKFFAVILIFFVVFSVPALAKKKEVVQPEDVESITVLASNSMAVPVAQLCKEYARKTNIDVNAVFASEADILVSIQNGDPADIVIIPSKKWFDELDKQGLLDASSKTILAKNRLVIAASKLFPFEKTKNYQDALNYIYNRALMIVADPDVTALGEQTLEALNKAGMWEKFASRVILAPTSSKAADLIIKGQSAGIIYASEAALNADKINQIILVPEKLHKPVEYFAAVVVGNDMQQARKFLQFLASQNAKILLKNQGFVVE